jgi:hypothetical protein
MICPPCKRQDHNECIALFQYGEINMPGIGMAETKFLLTVPKSTTCDCQHLPPASNSASWPINNPPREPEDDNASGSNTAW